MNADRDLAQVTAPWRPVALLALSAVPLHFLLALGTDLSPDEAYYLCAARLGPGTVLVDHPPIVRWMLQLSDGLRGLPVELRVRIWAIVCAFASTVITAALAMRYGEAERLASRGVWAAVVAAWALLPTAGGFITTPDGPLLLAIGAALLVDAGGRSPSRAVAVGALLFVGMLAKVVALPVGIALGWGVLRDSRTARDRLFALAPVLGPVAALPWAWASFRFQMNHAYGAAGIRPFEALGALVAAVSAQLVLWPAVVVWDGAKAVFRGGSRLPAAHRALVVGLTMLIGASAILRGIPPEPNWWAPAAVVVVAMGAGAATSLARRRAILVLALAPTLVASLHTFRPVLPLRPEADPTARLHGWRDGRGPAGAAGVGPYGPAAERCIYQNDCAEIQLYFR